MQTAIWCFPLLYDWMYSFSVWSVFLYLFFCESGSVVFLRSLCEIKLPVNDWSTLLWYQSVTQSRANYISKCCSFFLLPPPFGCIFVGEKERTTLITEAQRLTLNPVPETETDLHNQWVSCLIIIGAWLVCQRPDPPAAHLHHSPLINDPRHMRTMFTCRTPYRHIDWITVGIFSGT